MYLRGRALEIHDVDNRLKDILDALQGRRGRSKAVRRFAPMLTNDRQVYRVVLLLTRADRHGDEALLAKGGVAAGSYSVISGDRAD